MDQQGRQAVSDHPIEIIPPKRDNRSARDTVTLPLLSKEAPSDEHGLRRLWDL